MADFVSDDPPRFFNTVGPVVATKHYCLNPLDRINLKEILSLIRQEKYFVLHAPRQSGKTSCLLALAHHLNQSGSYHCLYINIEAAQPAQEDIAAVMHIILDLLASEALSSLKDTFFEQIRPKLLQENDPHTFLKEAFKQWGTYSDKPTVLLIDEIDSLAGKSLLSVLRQIRSGYANRPQEFPQSIILCGLRDVRDYKVSKNTGIGLQGETSAFNIKAESLKLGNFSQDEIQTLYQQHTDLIGQKFETDIFDRVWQLTEGQPWLVNALAYHACFKSNPDRDWSNPVTLKAIEKAKDALITSRETHLDQLADKLKEPRVIKVVAPILAGENFTYSRNDVDYACDLGLINADHQLRIANEIYREVIPRELTYEVQVGIAMEKTPDWYVGNDGRLVMDKLLKAFQEFFREHSQHWIEAMDYKESGPQLLLQAFLQRIVNGGGRIEREYGLGRKRMDLLIIWPAKEEKQKVVIELKIIREGLKRTIGKGLEQTAAYMDICGTDEGFLIVFDRSSKKSWSKKLFQRQEQFEGKAIQVWGM